MKSPSTAERTEADEPRTAWEFFQVFARSGAYRHHGGAIARVMGTLAKHVPAGGNSLPPTAAWWAFELRWPRNPRTRRALRRLAAERGVPMERVFVEAVQSALPLALAAADKEQRVRLGRRWVRYSICTAYGEILPPDERPSMVTPRRSDNELWHQWFRQEMFRQIDAALGVPQRKRDPLDDAPWYLEASPSWSESAGELEDDQPEASALREQLEAHASPQQREILRLVLDERCTRAEAAHVLGLSPATVRVQWLRLKRKALAARRAM